MSEVWERLAKDATDDKVIMETSYNVGLYGISAYHCQQCLEKIIKAVMLKNSFSKSTAKKLGHRPLSNTWNEFVKMCVKDVRKRKEDTKRRTEEMNEWGEDIRKSKMYSVLVSLRDASESLLDYVEKLAPHTIEEKNPDDSFKKLWWKWSLGIPFIGNEKNHWGDIFQRYKGNFTSQAREESHARSLRDTHNKKHTTTKNVGYVERQQSNNSCISFCMEMFEQFKNNYLNKRLIDQNFGSVPGTFSPFILLMPIHNCVFPHEDIGRYSQIVGGKSTTDWYNIKRVELRSLEKHVGEIFDFIKKNL